MHRPRNAFLNDIFLPHRWAGYLQSLLDRKDEGIKISLYHFHHEDFAGILHQWENSGNKKFISYINTSLLINNEAPMAIRSLVTNMCYGAQEIAASSAKGATVGALMASAVLCKKSS